MYSMEEIHGNRERIKRHVLKSVMPSNHDMLFMTQRHEFDLDTT